MLFGSDCKTSAMQTSQDPGHVHNLRIKSQSLIGPPSQGHWPRGGKVECRQAKGLGHTWSLKKEARLGHLKSVEGLGDSQETEGQRRDLHRNSKRRWYLCQGNSKVRHP